MTRLSRRALLKGTMEATAALALAGVGSAFDASPVLAATPWAKRLWGYLITPDGARLRYSVLLPAATGRFPVALQYCGYDAGTIGGSAYQQGNTWLSEDVDASLLDAGYAVMGLSMRGTGCSTGTFDLYGDTWATDGALGIEWAARQPWSTGKVGMYDWSWAGVGQLFAASERPTGLAAIAPGMAPTDPLRDVGAPGGVLNAQFPALWWATIIDSWTYDTQNALSDGDVEGVATVAANLVAGQFSSPVTAYGHPYYDAFWAQRDLRRRTAKIDVPVLSMEDWQDEEVGPRSGYYQELLDPRTVWYVGTNGEHDIYVNDIFRTELIAFLDRFVKGHANGFERTPRVRLWLETSASGAPMASDDELEAAKPGWTIELPTLPVPVTPVTLHLGSGGTLGSTPQPVTGGSATYEALPGPTVNNGLLTAITGDPGGPASEETWTTVPPVAGAHLAFTTAPLDRTVTLSGSASLNLWLASSEPDTDLQVTVTEVRPDGNETYVQRGWLRASQRAIDTTLATELRPVHRQTLASVQALIPGTPVLARVEINKFTHTFRQGSSLRILVDAPSGTGDWGFVALTGAANTVWCDRAHPSTLVIGVLSTKRAPTGYPTPNTLVGQPSRSNSITVPAQPAVSWPSVTPPSP